MKKERHKWEIILAEVKVEVQQLRDMNCRMTQLEQQFAIEQAEKAA